MICERFGKATLYLADCRDLVSSIDAPDCTITDPPYGVTNLEWDQIVDGWAELLGGNSLWCFGSMRFFMEQTFPGWKYAQEVIWEKHNGSNFSNDRFRRVHEIAVQFYRGEWSSVYREPLFTNDATARTVRKKKRPAHHLGATGETVYESQDGGPRMMRSVIFEPSTHGYAIHPTQKPLGILYPLIQYSCPVGGTVLDPFMGSGSTGIAAIDTGRKFIGIEVDRQKFEAACERFREHCRQGVLL